MDRTLVVGIVLFLLGLMVGISIPWEYSSPVQENILSIPSGSISLGSGGNNSVDTQFYSYNLTLYNSGSQEIYIESVEPVFNEEFGRLPVSDKNRAYVNKTIDPESSIQVSGNVEFNMTGLSKEDIFRMEPFTNSIEVNSVFILPYPHFAPDEA